MGLCIQESFVNVTEGSRFGDTDIYEVYENNIGDLYRSLIKEHGRCTGKMYQDPDGKQVGWVFVKRDQYEDSSEFYLREAWVTVYEKPAEVSTKTFPYSFNKGDKQ